MQKIKALILALLAVVCLPLAAQKKGYYVRPGGGADRTQGLPVFHT